MILKTLALLFLHSVLLGSFPETLSAFQPPAARRDHRLPITTISRTQQDLQRVSTSSPVRILSSYNDDEELPKFSSDIVPAQEEVEVVEKGKKKSDSKLLLQRLDEFGQSLKPRAQQVNAKAATAESQKRKIGYQLKACLFWTLYMGYRGYRGFFVILPAVFGQVYSKLQVAVNYRVLDDEDDSTTKETAAAYGDVNPVTGKIRWRTRITVSVLAGIVTFTYVIGGLARVLMKFVKTILSTSSLTGSFSAAAEEVEDNEDRLNRLGKI